MKQTLVRPTLQENKIKHIGQIIKELRKQQDISQEELCERVEITQTYLSLIENSKKEPSVELIKKISEVLAVPYQILYFFTINEDNIREDKKMIYNTMAPTLNKLIRTTFLEK